MSRTKGARDRNQRKMNPSSLANLPTPIPGFITAAVRIYAPTGDVRWFEGLEPKDRGAVVTKARKTFDL